jgi:hypothetical protein
MFILYRLFRFCSSYTWTFAVYYLQLFPSFACTWFYYISSKFDSIIIIIIIIIKHCPSAQCACAASVVGKYLDIFAVGAVSLNHIYTHQPKIINDIC